ncbi:sulfotransferase [Dongia deserti]|uniref:sulfotransferase n=1 Tax=Dongia deserti TaxID=2268030 RepID=UPI0013C41745|nr:sulfotransferase [Dongia deserti]
MRQELPTKYLYIVGRGHSGTTIFSMLAGQAHNVASEGEIITGFRPGYEGKRCANGETFSESSFWKAVKSAFEQRTGTPFADAMAVLNRRAHFSRAPANLLAPSRNAEVMEAKRLTEALYDSIAEASGRPVVLDSTKELATAIFLLRHVPEAKLIHFVRSPYGVVDSYVKRIRRTKTFDLFHKHFRVERSYFVPVAVGALVWTVESFICELLRVFYPRRLITLHYEDLCDQPIALLEKLESFTGVSLAESKAAARDGHAMQPSHALSGNRLMRTDEIVFSPRKGLPRYLTAFDKAVVTLCTLPMTLAYGYLGRRAIKPAMMMRPSTQ